MWDRTTKLLVMAAATVFLGGGSAFDSAVLADNGKTPHGPDISWVPISKSGFTGQMSKYETTNAQYAQYLNAAKASGDITIDGNFIMGASGSNAAQDFVGQKYYDLAGSGLTRDGATNGGTARINWTGSSFTVASGFEIHPVTYVSWYGATAFASSYGWRLPTEDEWQAVADYDGTYIYGCGTTINNSIANCNPVHPHGTTPVGQFGTYGYGMADMAGNAGEWTSSLWSSTSGDRVLLGGSWDGGDGCAVSARSHDLPSFMYCGVGFRVCRDDTPAQIVVPDVAGKTRADAEAAIIKAGLVVGTVSEAYNDTLATGLAISQNPAGGDTAFSGSSVNIVISIGLSRQDITWVYINDSGAGMKDGTGKPISQGGFTGEMSKYETTNAQYAQYLNAAKASGDITIDGNTVRGASGSNSGTDFVGEKYYDLDGMDWDAYRGKSRIDWTGSEFTVASGFENHPVTYVSWHAATAFASYYGWRLPTEWEWQAVADYDGTYIYGCGTTINKSIANYRNSINPHGTTPVGQFGAYGYGMADMAGNVWEWTHSLHSSTSSDRVIRGGSWYLSDDGCSVSDRYGVNSHKRGNHYGFRVCR